MTWAHWLLLILFHFPNSSWAEDPNELEPGFVRGPVVELDRDVRIPKMTVEEVTQIFKKMSFNEHDAVADNDSNPAIPRQDLKAKLYFHEQTAGVLIGKDVVVEMPSGGGLLDLSRLIHRGRGSFFWRIDLESAVSKEQEAVIKVYFLSRHRRYQRSDGPAIGMGCGKMADISTQFKATLGTSTGQLLNTAYGAHLGTLLGTYYFFVITKDAIKVATLTMNDPRAHGEGCGEESAGSARASGHIRALAAVASF
jgi:hypothetical protein